MKLLLAYVGPHIIQTDIEIGIAGEAETDNVKEYRQRLVRHLDIDVLKQNDIADIFLDVISRGSLQGIAFPSRLDGLNPLPLQRQPLFQSDPRAKPQLRLGPLGARLGAPYVTPLPVMALQVCAPAGNVLHHRNHR